MSFKYIKTKTTDQLQYTNISLSIVHSLTAAWLHDKREAGIRGNRNDVLYDDQLTGEKFMHHETLKLACNYAI